MKALRFGSAVSAVALATAITGCAAPHARSASALNSATANLAYGLRAQAALNSGDLVSAVDLAERAVEATPKDARVRGLLGNVYFASGRFASAEAAYGDALSLSPNEPQIILKRALVQIAQGKNSQALILLQSARNFIDAADYGLAVALAGQPAEAVEVLEPAARSQGADARVRQNLAMAYALAGDWTAARTIAAQDLTADQVDARVQQWMAMAKPGHSAEQVATLVGVTPAASDPGQPVRIALNPSEKGVAVAEASIAPSPLQVAQAAPVEQVVASDAPAFAAPIADPLSPPPVAVVQAAPAPAAPVSAIAAAAALAPEAPAAFAMSSNFAPARKPVAVKKPVRRAAAANPARDSKAVVQLGAYSSEARVSLAWAQLSKKYPALAGYSPVRARFDSPKGTVWRLSIRGFDNQQEAISSCQSLRSRGGNCFVRSTAGDSPVQLASR